MDSVISQAFANESPKSVFEIGCGSGTFLKQLQDKYKGLRVGGVDISAESAFDVGNIKDYVSDKKWDIAFSKGTLILIPPSEIEAAIESIRRLSKRVIFIELASDGLHSMVGNYHAYDYRFLLQGFKTVSISDVFADWPSSRLQGSIIKADVL